MIGAVGILRDMRELDKARAYAESLIKFAPDPVFVSDLEGKILQANDAVSELLGFRAGRGDRAVAVAVHQPGGDARVHRRPARGRRQGGDPRRPAQPPQRQRRRDPDDAERVGPARPGRAGDRGDRHPPRHARTGQGAGGGRDRQPGQEPVPGEHEPRAADPAQRHHPVHRTAPRRGDRPQARRLPPRPEEDPRGGPPPAHAHQRRPRPGPGRVGQARPAPGDVRRRGHGPRRGHHHPAARPEERQRPGGPLPGRRRDDARRPDQGPPEPVQPPVERLQVHRGRERPAGGRAGRPGRRVAHLPGDRHRDRDDPRPPEQAVQAVLPGGPVGHPAVRRVRPRAGHHPPLLPGDGRGHRGREPARGGVHVHHPAAGRGRGGAAPAAPVGRRRPSCRPGRGATRSW